MAASQGQWNQPGGFAMALPYPTDSIRPADLQPQADKRHCNKQCLHPSCPHSLPLAQTKERSRSEVQSRSLSFLPFCGDIVAILRKILLPAQYSNFQVLAKPAPAPALPSPAPRHGRCEQSLRLARFYSISNSWTAVLPSEMLKVDCGGVLVLQSKKFEQVVKFRAELLPSKPKSDEVRVLLAKPDDPYRRLHLSHRGVEYKSVSSPNKDCILMLSPVDSSGWFTLHTQIDGSSLEGLFLSLQCDGSLSVQRASLSSSALEAECHFQQLPSSSASTDPLSPPSCSSALPRWDVRDFVLRGYFHQQVVVPISLVDECNRFLLHHQGQVGTLIAGAVQGGSYGKFPGLFSHHPIVRSLFCGELKCLVETFLGASIDQFQNLSAQIAFRFPELPEEAARFKDWGKCQRARVRFHTCQPVRLPATYLVCGNRVAY